jgi:mannosyltransferase OCH1-like enzyme
MSDLDFLDLDKYLVAQKGKIIHQVWFGTIPNKRKAIKTYEKYKKYRDSWKIKNPTWFHIEWSKKMSIKLIKTFFPEHYEMFRKYPYDIQRCDAIRYMFLYRYGGLYADMDYYCNKSFNLVFKKYQKPLYLVQTPNRNGDYVSNSLMYSKPMHPFWKSLLIEMEICQNTPVYYGKHLSVMFSTGPGIVNRVYQKCLKKYKLKSWSHILFQPHTHTDNIMTLKNKNVYAIHMSGGCWHSHDSILIILICKEWKFLTLIFITIMLVIIITKKLSI